MAGHGKSKSKGRTRPLPPWVEEVPTAERKQCVNNHGSARTWPTAMYRALENTQGGKLEKPLNLCGNCLLRMEKARARHDEYAGSVLRRNQEAHHLKNALKVFEETTGVDLKGFALLIEGTFRMGAEDVVELARAIEERYEGRAAEELSGETRGAAAHLEIKPAEPARVLKFRTRVPHSQ